MATSASENIKESVTIQKDIKIPNFSQKSAAPNSAIFYYKDTEPFCKVFVNPVCRSNQEFVSLRVRRCSFYPRFFPGVIYHSLGWTASVVDSEGMEKYLSYFGYEDIHSLDWVEDFFSERGYELEEFVKRSVLLEDPERFLPGGVLTVRVQMFYGCRVADEAVAMETRGEEIQAFVVKPFLEQQVALAEKKLGNVQTDSNSNDEDPKEKDVDSIAEESKDKDVDSIAEDSKKLTELEFGFQDLSLEGKNFHDELGYWKKEIVLMMKETFQELKEAFELYAKLQQLKDIVERTPQPLDSEDIDFCPDLFQDMDLFQGLFMEVGLGPPIEGDFLSWMEQPFGVVNVSHQLARILAIHKHLQTHWEKCKEVYKRAAEKKFERSDDTQGAHKCAVAEGIRELFFIYGEAVKENRSEKPDHHLVCVSRFLKVFSTVIRILSLRLYWPVCVLQQPPPPPSTTFDDEDRTMSKKDVDEIGDKSSFVSTRVTSEDNKHTAILEDTEKIVPSEASEIVDTETELWYFTIETSDHKRFEIPFRTGTTTLGSLLRSASPVFDRMLETPMTEQSSRYLKMDDFESSTFCRFLSYLESGGKVDVDLSLQECGELYQLAHKYQAQKLVLDCVRKISEIMDHTEAEDVAEFSKFYGDDTLMSMVEAFRFRPRATMAVWGLTSDDLDVAPLSPETTWAKSVKDVPVVEKAIEAVQPEEKYEFYE